MKDDGANENRRIAVLPIGYGYGFTRVRNLGHALIHGQRAPIVGGVSMDALTVDITEIPEAKLWDVTTLMGRDGAEEISVHEIAKLKNSAGYDALCSWRGRLPRIYVNDQKSATRNSCSPKQSRITATIFFRTTSGRFPSPAKLPPIC